MDNLEMGKNVELLFFPFAVSLFLKKISALVFRCVYSVICCLYSCAWKKMPKLLYIHRSIAGKNRKNEKYPLVLVCISASWKGLFRLRLKKKYVSFLFSLVWLVFKFWKNPNWEQSCWTHDVTWPLKKKNWKIFHCYTLSNVVDVVSPCCCAFHSKNQKYEILYYLVIYSDCRVMRTASEKIVPQWNKKKKKCIQITDNSNCIYEKHHFKLLLTLAASLHSHRMKRIA